MWSGGFVTIHNYLWFPVFGPPPMPSHSLEAKLRSYVTVHPLHNPMDRAPQTRASRSMHGPNILLTSWQWCERTQNDVVGLLLPDQHSLTKVWCRAQYRPAYHGAETCGLRIHPLETAFLQTWYTFHCLGRVVSQLCPYSCGIYHSFSDANFMSWGSRCTSQWKANSLSQCTPSHSNFVAYKVVQAFERNQLKSSSEKLFSFDSLEHSRGHLWRRQLRIWCVLLTQLLRIHSPVKILPRIESVQHNNSDDDHSVKQSVSDDWPRWKTLDLHSLQNHKVCLLLHQWATPPASKFNDAVNASNLNE